MTEHSDLYPNQKELLEDDQFWRLYREMYRRTRSVAMIRWQIGTDLGPMGSKGVVAEGVGEYDWDSMETEEIEDLASTLVDSLVDDNSNGKEFREACERGDVWNSFAPPIENRLQEMLSGFGGEPA